jgi:hypothetical protein
MGSRKNGPNTGYEVNIKLKSFAEDYSRGKIKSKHSEENKFLEFLEEIQREASALLDTQRDEFNERGLWILQELSSELEYEYELSCEHRTAPEVAFEYAFMMGYRAAQAGLGEASKYTLEKEKRRLSGINTGGKNKATKARKADQRYRLEAKSIILELWTKNRAVSKAFLVRNTLKKMKDPEAASTWTIERLIDDMDRSGEITLAKKGARQKEF